MSECVCVCVCVCVSGLSSLALSFSFTRDLPGPLAIQATFSETTLSSLLFGWFVRFCRGRDRP